MDYRLVIAVLSSVVLDCKCIRPAGELHFELLNVQLKSLDLISRFVDLLFQVHFSCLTNNEWKPLTNYCIIKIQYIFLVVLTHYAQKSFSYKTKHSHWGQMYILYTCHDMCYTQMYITQRLVRCEWKYNTNHGLQKCLKGTNAHKNIKKVARQNKVKNICEEVNIQVGSSNAIFVILIVSNIADYKNYHQLMLCHWKSWHSSSKVEKKKVEGLKVKIFTEHFPHHQLCIWSD